MEEVVTITLSLPAALFQQVEAAAADLKLPPERLLEQAVAQAVAIGTFAPPAETRPAIHQGDVFWVQPVIDGEPAIPHPYVVVQDNLFNHSRLDTVVVCALTTNRKRTSYPGCVLLEAGEANLPKASVVEVSKIASVAKARLGAYIGSLSQQRVQQILAGIRFLQTSFWKR